MLRRFLLDPVRTVLTAIAVAVWTIVGGLAVVVIGRRNPASPLVDRIARIWCWIWLKLNNVRVEAVGQENVEPGRSYVFVSNHLSGFDIMAEFVAIPAPIRFLAKKELFSIPFFGPAMRAAGIIEVDRKAGAAVHEQINRQSERMIRLGHSLLIYPEGTRSRTGELLPFKKGAFTIAVTLQVPIVPVTVCGTREVWQPGKRIFHGDRTVRVVIHEPIPTEGLTLKDANELRDRAREIIRRTFESGCQVEASGQGHEGSQEAPQPEEPQQQEPQTDKPQVEGPGAG